MKLTSLLALMLTVNLFTTTASASGEAFEFEVHGMTCAFCVDALRRKLEALPEVESAEVSLRQNRVRLHLTREALDRMKLRQAVIDAGFSPVGLEDPDEVQ